MLDINIIFKIIAPLILWLKTRDDITYKDLITIFKPNDKFRNLIWQSQFYFLTLYFFLKVLEIFHKNTSLINKYSIFILTLSCLIGLIKRRYKLYNSIEEIYEACSELVIILYINNFSNAAWIISISVLFTSISAGISKVKSKLWSHNGSRSGLIQYLTLPSVSRKFIRNYSSIYYKKYKFVKVILQIITIFTPWIQIISAIGLLLAKFLGLILLSKIFFFFQISFIFLLYIISDLSWITSFYSFLIISVFSINLENFFSYNILINSINLVCFIFIFIFTLRVLFGNNKFLKRSLASYSSLTFDVVPFKMFTEVHMTNLITYFIKFEESKGLKNHFDKKGYRNQNQNHSSRHMQALMYPLCDLCINLYRDENSSSPYKSKLHKKQCQKIIEVFPLSEIIFFQHRFSEKKGCYDSKIIAKLKIPREIDSSKYNLEKYNTILETSR